MKNAALIPTDMPYLFLPFRFKRFHDRKILLVNETGEFIFLPSEEFESLISYKLDRKSGVYRDLKAKHFITSAHSELAPVIDLLATKYRTKKSFLRNFTSLHMVVVTLRCNHRCNYCHASSQEADARRWDMSIETSRKVVDMIFQSPSPYIKIEFQGGEPLLNFKVVKEIIKYAEKINHRLRKHLSFVLCTNLTLIDKDILNFLKEHDVIISTSLDGPKDIHDSNRVLRDGGSSYDCFVDKLFLTRSVLGINKVSALMTVTNTNIHDLKKIIDEYVRLEFRGIFLRSLNPYGYAKKGSGEKLQYKVEEFVLAYEDAIEYILQLNREGIAFVEYFAKIILTRILTPFSTGFMDLQSPAGAGILGAIYNYNGRIYPSDEARMLSAMGDNHFCLGDVNHSSYMEVFCSKHLAKIVQNSCVEIIPGCHSCAYQLYCGADPVRAYSQQKDSTYIGHMPTSEFCKKHMNLIDYFMRKIEQCDEDALDIFWSWVTNRNLPDITIQ